MRWRAVVQGREEEIADKDSASSRPRREKLRGKIDLL